MSKGFEWRDRDGAGFFYGFYREGDKQYHLDIACPGLSVSRRAGITGSLSMASRSEQPRRCRPHSNFSLSFSKRDFTKISAVKKAPK